MPRWVVMFTGQGSQQIGMGREWDAAPESQEVWDCASEIAGKDLRRLCWKGPMPLLAQTRWQQLAVTAVNLAGWYALKAQGTLPDAPVLIGHSVGEYSALHAGGALDLESTFKAVQARAQLMQAQAEATDGAMYAIKGGASAQIKALLEQMGLAAEVVIANDNSPAQVVIAGASNAVKTAAATLAESGFPSVKLAVNGAWHSPLMAGMRGAFSTVLNGLDLRMPTASVWMNRTAHEAATVDEIRENLTSHVVETVRWRESIETLLQRGHRQFLEIGPRKILCALLPAYGEAGTHAQALHAQQWHKRAC